MCRIEPRLFRFWYGQPGSVAGSLGKLGSSRDGTPQVISRRPKVCEMFAWSNQALTAMRAPIIVQAERAGETKARVIGRYVFRHQVPGPSHEACA